MMTWLLRWRISRAELALADARDYRYACEDTNEKYEGAYLSYVVHARVRERELEREVGRLRKRLGATS